MTNHRFRLLASAVLMAALVLFSGCNRLRGKESIRRVYDLPDGLEWHGKADIAEAWEAPKE